MTTRAARLRRNARRRQQRNWEILRCFCYAGIVADAYGEPKECEYCNGGVYYRHRKTGTLAQWPGGPLLGREPKRVP